MLPESLRLRKKAQASKIAARTYTYGKDLLDKNRRGHSAKSHNHTAVTEESADLTSFDSPIDPSQ